jgi:hypothetical protein
LKAGNQNNQNERKRENNYKKQLITGRISKEINEQSIL